MFQSSHLTVPKLLLDRHALIRMSFDKKPSILCCKRCFNQVSICKCTTRPYEIPPGKTQKMARNLSSKEQSKCTFCDEKLTEFGKSLCGNKKGRKYSDCRKLKGRHGETYL